MTISITIPSTAFDAAGPLEEFATRKNQPYGNTVPSPSFNNPPGTTGAPGPGYIASASRLVKTTNILEDGTFPDAFGAAIDQIADVVVHVSPTSGSTIIRGNNWTPSNAEFDPAYGLDVTTAGVELQNDIFETAINEPVGAQFTANLQDYVARGILLVKDQAGVTLTPGTIAAYTAP
jgi:hypothetical protein